MELVSLMRLRPENERTIAADRAERQAATGQTTANTDSNHEQCSDQQHGETSPTGNVQHRSSQYVPRRFMKPRNSHTWCFISAIKTYLIV